MEWARADSQTNSINPASFGCGVFMFSERYRCAADAARADLPRRRILAILAALFALTVATCTTDGLTTASVSTPRASIAFERIDGPPEYVFRKLVQNLSEEAEARQIAVVSREGVARYRIRGYVAAHMRSGRMMIAWVLDIYDADQNRALRISGEEDAGRAGKNTWETDEEVLHRISHAAMDRIASFLSAPSQQASLTAPGPLDRLFAIAGSSDDFSPESTGIFRSPGARDATGMDSTEDLQLPATDAPSPKARSAARTGSVGVDTIASISH